jgi:SAM-dependent methyltransferase
MNQPETWYPLQVLVCHSCWLVQTEDFVAADEMFSPDYAYFSSFSSSFLSHVSKYVNNIAKKLSLEEKSMVVEVAANDGYLLQYVKQKGIPCYGIEPTNSTAEAARAKGIEIIGEFFGVKLANRLAKNGRHADLIVANNVLAHVPDINDFVSGFTALLKKNGVATFENPHLLQLVKQKQFDTVYHEHYSYLSVTSVNEIFKSNGLTLFDVEEFPIHGGSLRYYAQRSDTGQNPVSENVENLQRLEERAGMKKLDFYQAFQREAEIVKAGFLRFLLDQKAKGKVVAAYGAAAKGNTMLNFCGLKPDLLRFIVDKNPVKQNTYAPGSRIPIVSEQVLIEQKPDYLVIMPWNLRQEIQTQLNYVLQWNCQFVVAIPELEIL